MRFLFYLIILGISSNLLCQNNFDITINNTNEVWPANIFFQEKYQNPPRPVKIISPEGEEIFSETWQQQGRNFTLNYNNKITFYNGISDGWIVMDSLQSIIDSVYCLNGYTADGHDFLALENGSYVLFAYDNQPYAMDTVVEGGDPNAMVEGLIIQELDSNHNLIFEWKSWDHFHVTDNQYLEPWNMSDLNFIHANAIEIDFDGHFLLSSRHLDEITKIHRTTGDIIWRWGGTQGEFIFLNDHPFTYQHSISSLGNNRYILFDNGNQSQNYYDGAYVSRAVEYELDTINMTAEKIWEFIHPDSLYSPTIGSVQRLPNGNTLVNFGNLSQAGLGAILSEVNYDGEIVFQLEYNPGFSIYRAKKFDWFFHDQSIENVVENIKKEKTLLSRSDLLGREVKHKTNQIILYIYDDGSVEKKFIIE